MGLDMRNHFVPEEKERVPGNHIRNHETAAREPPWDLENALWILTTLLSPAPLVFQPLASVLPLALLLPCLVGRRIEKAFGRFLSSVLQQLGYCTDSCSAIVLAWDSRLGLSV